jgi:type I restriction enzyme S subunit
VSELLLKNIHAIAKSPDGVHRLRQLILDLAVRGLLVKRNPLDEPASEMIARAQSQVLPAQPHPYAVPRGWEWVSLDSISSYVQRGKSPTYSDAPGFRVISQKCVRWEGLDLSKARYVEPSSLDSYEETRFLRDGDILWNSTGTGTVGRACLVQGVGIGEKLVADSHVTVVRPDLADARFMCKWIESPTTQASILRQTTGSTNQVELNTSVVKNLPFALPPIQEQVRIVARVEELMGLCDELETLQRAEASAQEQLAASALGVLAASGQQGDFEANWEFVSREFESILTTVQSVEMLRQVILELAVRGRLVPQRVEDEPAGELLARIAAEKQRRVGLGRLRNHKLLPPLRAEEVPHALPKGWAWAHFDDATLDIATGPFGSLIHKEDYVTGGVPLVNPSHMVNGRIVADPRVTLPKEMAATLDSYLLEAGDIVMARRGEAGRAALVTPVESGWICGTGSFIVRFIPEMNRRFVQLVLAGRGSRAFLGGEAVGSTMSNLNHGILKRMPFPVPPLGEQERIVHRVDEIMALCDQLAKSIDAVVRVHKSVATALTKLEVGAEG